MPVVKIVTLSEHMYRLVLKNCHVQEGVYATKCDGITKLNPVLFHRASSFLPKEDEANNVTE